MDNGESITVENFAVRVTTPLECNGRQKTQDHSMSWAAREHSKINLDRRTVEHDTLSLLSHLGKQGQGRSAETASFQANSRTDWVSVLIAKRWYGCCTSSTLLADESLQDIVFTQRLWALSYPEDTCSTMKTQAGSHGSAALWDPERHKARETNV